MSDLYVYTTPLEADVTLALDDGRTMPGEPCVAHGRDDAHRIPLPPDVTGQGAVLRVTCSGFVPFDNRGILNPVRPCFELDDIRLTPEPPPPVPPPRDPTLDPQALCQAIYEQGDFDLATKEGCGLYTEECCRQLFQQHWYGWGHIRKNPSQNNYNGHAVDALQLLTQAGGTQPGIYDIIWSTESPDAKPAWSYKGPPDLNLWYPPV
jgi:hypothetical protein